MCVRECVANTPRSIVDVIFYTNYTKPLFFHGIFTHQFWPY
jgi:hypothetical protein